MTDIIGALIIEQVPYRRAYLLFGSPRYQWKHIEPWMVISFAVGVHLASGRVVQNWIREEPGNKYRMAAVNQMLNKNPMSYSTAQTFPYEFFPFARGGDSYTSTVEFLASNIEHGATFGVFGGQPATDMVEPWIDGEGRDALQPEFRDGPTMLDFWQPRPSFSDLKRFAESQLSMMA